MQMWLIVFVNFQFLSFGLRHAVVATAMSCETKRYSTLAS